MAASICNRLGIRGRDLLSGRRRTCGLGEAEDVDRRLAPAPPGRRSPRRDRGQGDAGSQRLSLSKTSAYNSFKHERTQQLEGETWIYEEIN